MATSTMKKRRIKEIKRKRATQEMRSERLKMLALVLRSQWEGKL